MRRVPLKGIRKERLELRDTGHLQRRQRDVHRNDRTCAIDPAMRQARRQYGVRHPARHRGVREQRTGVPAGAVHSEAGMTVQVRRQFHLDPDEDNRRILRIRKHDDRREPVNHLFGHLVQQGLQIRHRKHGRLYDRSDSGQVRSGSREDGLRLGFADIRARRGNRQSGLLRARTDASRTAQDRRLSIVVPHDFQKGIQP